MLLVISGETSTKFGPLGARTREIVGYLKSASPIKVGCDCYCAPPASFPPMPISVWTFPKSTIHGATYRDIFRSRRPNELLCSNCTLHLGQGTDYGMQPTILAISKSFARLGWGFTFRKLPKTASIWRKPFHTAGPVPSVN